MEQFGRPRGVLTAVSAIVAAVQSAMLVGGVRFDSDTQQTQRAQHGLVKEYAKFT